MSNINFCALKEKLEKCRNTSLNEIDINTIPELSELKIGKKKAPNERIIDFISEVSNPYIFKINGKLVKIEFSNSNKTADSCITNVIKSIYK